ncbi:hypothetical protein P175DRAFT_0427513 [Aspergillus ochraceoroseus IBT 24754]|uniref:Fatty acid hydroxylase domain-containing protein n=2 Tax=Aspergillus subgen. Nidulantes TaxID=2720870 RepID=A0A0F8WPN7_9EURO|nr:uncharacterized protein P175DRAFT_0427513 [Aspergillus ochraceoroseus IBT 24754]KKK13227.1 hypothetical protein ARAM_000552 [Aspergillus rambellii]PTU24636.1 hypothetical protein P175DRAFT_0427513 [Aspergillus ochraceoroseus IBT 24754]
MDIVLDVLDTLVLDRLYAALLPAPEGVRPVAVEYNSHVARYMELQPTKWAGMSQLARDSIIRQMFSLFLLTWIFGVLVYFVSSTLSFFFVFDKKFMMHPKFLRDQINLEIKQSMRAMPVMAALTAPFFVAELRGYSRLYDFPSEAPFQLYTYLQFPLFIAFTDFCIYWIHRALHHPLIYKWLHKSHHKWIVPTPYASFAFNPVDGWSQSVPYHVFPFVFPLQKTAYLMLFAFVTVWTVIIHDGEYATSSPVINGSACHTYHHLYFNYNYGQFTTLWDRLGGSYRQPDAELFDREIKMGKSQWEKQVKEMEKIVREVEGEDDREYGEVSKKMQ